MFLPSEEKLDIGHFSRVFDGTRVFTCYKFFWLLGIMKLLSDGKNIMSYDEIIVEMIVEAWFMVTDCKLRLGPSNTTDNLEKAVYYLYKDIFEEKVKTNENKTVLRSKIKTVEDEKFKSIKKEIIEDVPYCMQSPFYSNIKSPKKNKIEQINQQKRLIYYFTKYDSLNTTIIISDEWVEYLIRNKEIINDWIKYNLLEYLQKKNPSVPGIIDKFAPPSKRNLERVRNYWKAVIDVKPDLNDIYGEINLSNISISIDHFVPWQYVAHDELWNLSPTTRKINSNKSNKLPSWDKYFEKLVNIEYEAYKLSFSNELVKKEFNSCVDYHLNNSEIRYALYAEELDIVQFRNKLFKIIHPVYESARNCGFQEW